VFWRLKHSFSGPKTALKADVSFLSAGAPLLHSKYSSIHHKQRAGVVLSLSIHELSPTRPSASLTSLPLAESYLSRPLLSGWQLVAFVAGTGAIGGQTLQDGLAAQSATCPFRRLEGWLAPW
jgi:hypothetical protein